MQLSRGATGRRYPVCEGRWVGMRLNAVRT